MNRVGLFVELKARPGKGGEVAAFLAGAREAAAAEPETLVWFALRFDEERFGIFDSFADETGRAAHLNGPIAAALMDHAEALLAEPPTIRQVDVLADLIRAATRD
ncbi:putative quinol monooxygenase [Sphingomonas mali]|uniref:putative quinol monooxygenase n=1 Tax=Sphingomonas mali TaxID=40682 RepID=UPI00082AD0C3|nr:antibiotic biosynthesis monooxygenase [Sphingomonas mali]